jgi:hypothetical protein
MKYRWNDSDRGKPKYAEKTLSQFHLIHHKPHMDWSVIKIVSSPYDAGE